MNDSDLDLVMDDVLDGTAEPETRRRLEQRLAADPVLRERFAAREALFRALAGPPIADPPTELLPAVMREIAASGSPAAPAARARRPGSVGWGATLISAFRYRPARAWGYAATFAALAVMLVVVASRLPSLSGPHSLPASGTIGAPAGGRPPLLARGVVTTPDARVIAEARPGAGVAIELAFHTESAGGVPVTVAIAVEPGDATLVGEGPGLSGSSAPGTSVRFDDARFGVVQVHRSRPGPLRLVLTASSPAGGSHTVLEIPADVR